MNTLQQFLDECHVSTMTGGNHKHVRHGWLGLQCPWCHTTSWHLGIRLADGHTTCWRCGGHRLADVLITVSGQPWSAVLPVVKEVQKRTGIAGTRVKSSGRLKLPKGITPLGRAHKLYLKDRGFNPDDIQDKWDVQGLGLESPLSWRLFIPVKINGQTVSWTTRSIGSADPKYISASPDAESVPIKSTLYGADLVPGHVIVVVEGPADAWAIGPGAVAVFGLNVSLTQLAEIQSYPVRVVCFDSDDDAQRRADQLCRRLDQSYETSGETHQVQLETGSDPGDADHDEILELRKRFGLPAELGVCQK